MSKDKTPVLAGTIPTLERLMDGLETLAAEQPHLEPAIAAGLESAIKYYNKLDDTKAYVIALCEFKHIFYTYI